MTRSRSPLALSDLPGYTARELGLRGLALPTDLLAGVRLSQLDALRDAGDKDQCPCLLLVESQPLDFRAPADRAASIERMRKLAAAAARLGCSAIGIKPAAVTDDHAFNQTAQGIKEALSALDRMEVNVLLQPAPGLIDPPAGLTELIKKVGGFRIGSLPSFEHAHASGETEQTLRRLAPYATSAILATVRGFGKGDRHEPWDLVRCVEAVRSVGYVNTLCIDFVGKGDPTKAIEQARDQMSEAILAEEPA
ncbi:MAG: TIM barrel protein [Phycisphaeraceae bacterium]|nr:TIM barrel protein [Phycisphaeraceae bacterium]